MKLVPLSLMFALVVLAGFSTSAGAAPSSRSIPERAGSFCGVARGVARSILNSTSVSNSRVSPANAKATWLKVAAAEPALLASAPKRIKADLRPVFGFVNLLIADYKKVNWNGAGLAPYAPTLLARAQAIQKPLNALKVYFKTTCKLNV
jgi:hypothetical protein